MRGAVMREGRWFVAVLASACGPVVGVGGSGTTSGDASTSGGVMMPTTSGVGENATGSDQVTTAQPDPTTPITTEGEETTTSTETGESETPSFVIGVDGGNGALECDPWAQDCPRGEKCMPWANDGGGSWNATRCSPIADAPREVGESCTVEGSGVSGIDDCGLASMCWDVDPETNVGECVAFCDGSAANPSCADPCMQCTIYNEGVLILCLPMCDPLAQDCDRGSACYASGDAFICGPDPAPEQGQVGDPCTFFNDCDPGLYCADAALVPECAAESCCTQFCDVDDSDPCNTIESGKTCTPWFEGAQPETCLGMGTVGVCTVPA